MIRRDVMLNENCFVYKIEVTTASTIDYSIEPMRNAKKETVGEVIIETRIFARI